MRILATVAAAAIVLGACGGTASAPTATPTPTATRTASPTPSPTPSPAPASALKAELKSSNQSPPITDAEASCAGSATVTITGTSVKFDVTISGCPANTAINIGHIHEGAAGVNGPVKIDSTLKAGELTLTGGGATLSRTATAEAALIQQVLANPAGFYVNFHSTLHPAGVIRGQLTKA